MVGALLCSQINGKRLLNENCWDRAHFQMARFSLEFLLQMKTLLRVSKGIWTLSFGSLRWIGFEADLSLKKNNIQKKNHFVGTWIRFLPLVRHCDNHYTTKSIDVGVVNSTWVYDTYVRKLHGFSSFFFFLIILDYSHIIY